MNRPFNTDHVSEKFKESKHFPAYTKAVEAYNDLPWEKAADPEVAKEITGLTALFSVEFNKNNNAALNHFSRKNSRRPNFQENSYKVILDLSKDELAGGLRDDGSGTEPHSMLAIEAAYEAGFDVSNILNIVGIKFSKNADNEPEFMDKITPAREKPTGNPLWDKFLNILPKYQETLSGSIGVLGLGGEMILSTIFKQISDNLPEDKDFSKMKFFFERHISIDFSSGGHEDKMISVLEEDYINKDTSLKTATELLNNKAKMYEQVLNKRSIDKVKLDDKSLRYSYSKNKEKPPYAVAR